MSPPGSMITLAQCDDYLGECRTLEMATDVSDRRATAITAVAHAWAKLSREVAHYYAVVKDEDE